MTQHKRIRGEIRVNDEEALVIESGAGTFSIGETHDHCSPPHDRNEAIANAHRLAACWNGCEWSYIENPEALLGLIELVEFASDPANVVSSGAWREKLIELRGES